MQWKMYSKALYINEEFMTYILTVAFPLVSLDKSLNSAWFLEPFEVDFNPICIPINFNSIPTLIINYHVLPQCSSLKFMRLLMEQIVNSKTSLKLG